MTLFYGLSALLSAEMKSVDRDDPILPERLQTMNSYGFKPGIGINAGIIVPINNGFYFVAEMNPHLFFNYITTESMGNEGSLEKRIYTKKGVEFDLNSENLRLSIVYRWHIN